MTENCWSDSNAAGLDAIGLLVYRSRLLGADPTLSNRGGGNTSVKRVVTDFRGREVRALTVKGTGADLATITPDGFADLSLDDLLPLRDRVTMSDEEMVDYVAHTMLNTKSPRPSIETLLHAFLSATHIDHVHANVAVALATAQHGESLLRELFGDDAVWVPYRRPGFALGKLAVNRIAAQPSARFALLQKHGLVTWSDDAKQCYNQTIEFLSKAETFINDKSKGKRVFGSPGASADAATMPSTGSGNVAPSGTANAPSAPTSPLTLSHVEGRAAEADQRRALAEAVLPGLRGLLSPPAQHVILQYDDSPEVLEFVASDSGLALARSGLALPDHVLYTRVLPMVVRTGDPHPNPLPEGEGTNFADGETLLVAAREALASYHNEYHRFFEAHQQPDDVELDASPTIVLIPGVGMIAAGPDKRSASTAVECYRRAIAIMRDAEAIDRFQPLTEEEAYSVEYWPLERYKLSLQPKRGELAGHVAFITGAAGGLGAAIAQRFAAEGAHVVIADINEEGATARCQELASAYGEGIALAVRIDVTSEADMQRAMAETVRTFGGLDILVCNAGVGFSKPIEQTTLAEWSRTLDILTTGYFLTAREGLRVMRQQRTASDEPLGGSVLFIASKAGLAAAKDAAAYATAKAAVLHLARCLVEEVSGDAIRVNSLAPDAIIQGSGFWAGQWGQARAQSHGVPMDQLADFYKGRNLLKISVTAEDVSEAALFFVSDRSRATTGGVLTVDGGLHDGYVR